MAGKKKKKKNNKKLMIIVCFAAGIAVFTIGTAVAAKVLGTDSASDLTNNVNVSNVASVVNNQVATTRDAAWDSYRVDTTVEIQMEDFAAPVGTQLKVVALVTPENTDTSVTWTTSDSSIFTVTNEGLVVIRGKGTGVLTATAGNVSDSIVVEGIESVAQGSVNDLPIYTADSGNLIYYSDASDNSGGTYTGTSNNGSDTASYVETGNTQVSDGGTGTTQNNSGENSDSGQTGSNTGSSQLTGTDSDSLHPTGGNGGYDSTNVGSVIQSEGFDQVVSNVYVYNEDGQYYGEIITQSDVTIIYIKQRGAGFDQKVQSVIASMIPQSYAQVWNTYQTANTDKTFVADNKTVRIVVPQNGGHSQIVIYN